jgi:hypothetical protein
LALYKTGYHLWTPKKEDIERTGWAEEDSAMFYNHNQEVQAKIYNKLKDFKNVVSVEGMGGLLRFELSLKRNFLKNSGLIQKGNTPFEILPEVFSCILHGAEELMQTHIVGALWSGNFLSKKLHTKYIKRHCKTKEGKMEKMLKCRDECRDGILVTGGKVLDYFEEIELSPLYASKEFPYVPSFARLLRGEENERFVRFTERHSGKSR